MNIGERVGDYEIVEVLGAGGMGQVYKVRNLLSERIEAMKVLLPNLESDPGLADRFLREIKVQATLDHPNIAKLHTAMRAGNQLLMFMEFVDGVSLAKRIESGPLAPGEAGAITTQVLDALAYAHGRAVVHRDIKPANIMMTGAGVAKLMDFGIARMQADTRLTQTGRAVGSLFYMSPEQIRGAEPDRRSDLYSLGITLYEMVTGRRPFAGDSDYQIMSAHLQQAPVAPIEVVPGVPADLNEIILMAIAKDPGARFQSAAAFRAALVNVFPGIASAPSTVTQTMAPVVIPPAPVRSASAMFAAAPPAVPPVSSAQMPPPVGANWPTPAAPPPVMPAPKSSSRRGLYMALGSVVTVAVLIAAVIEGPKLIHGGSSGAAGAAGTPASSTPASVSATPAAATPPPVAVTAPAEPAAPVPVPNGQAASVPATKTATRASAPAVSPSPSPSAARAASSGGAPAASPSSPAPATPSAAPSLAQPASAQPAAQPPPVRPAVNPELAELRERFNELSIRASTARAGLQSLQQQQASQGLGLRGDIREAQTRMDYQLQEAMSSLQRGDPDGARQNMRYAQSAVEAIEKFLGR